MKIVLVRSADNHWNPTWVYMLIFPKGYQYGRTFHTLGEAQKHAGLSKV